MVILKNKGRRRLSRNLLIRAATYDTVRDRNVLLLHQINTVEMEMKIWRMVRLTNTLSEDDRCNMNPESSSGIYMTVLN